MPCIFSILVASSTGAPALRRRLQHLVLRLRHVLLEDLFGELTKLIGFDDLGGGRCFVLFTDGVGPFEFLLARDGGEAVRALAFLELRERHIERHRRCEP